jgi:hypothetical protein
MTRNTTHKDTPARVSELTALAQRLAPDGADYELWRLLAARRRRADSER